MERWFVDTIRKLLCRGRQCESCHKSNTKENPVEWCDGSRWLCKDCDELEWACT